MIVNLQVPMSVDVVTIRFEGSAIRLYNDIDTLDDMHLCNIVHQSVG